LNRRIKVSLIVGLLAGPWRPVARADDPPKSPPPAASHFHLADLLPRGVQKNPQLNLSVITEFTPAGKALPPPTRNKPIYYTLWDGGMAEEGEVLGEHPPPLEKLAQVMERALASNGYRRAVEAAIPTVIVYYRWGSFNHLFAPDPRDDRALSDGMGDLNDPQQLMNLLARSELVGGRKFTTDLVAALNNRAADNLDFFRLRDERTGPLLTLAVSDLYFLVAQVYDYESAQHGKKKLLWTTKISTDSLGLAMRDALPAIVTQGGRYFGQDTGGPVVFHPRMYEGHVEIGDAEVKGYIDNPPPAQRIPVPARKH